MLLGKKATACLQEGLVGVSRRSRERAGGGGGKSNAAAEMKIDGVSLVEPSATDDPHAMGPVAVVIDIDLDALAQKVRASHGEEKWMRCCWGDCFDSLSSRPAAHLVF